MIALDPSGYVRQPWKNGGGVSEEIAARREGEGWEGLVWSFSRTGFSGRARFSDLSGVARVLVLASGAAFTLRALDAGADIAVEPAAPVAFDGGRRLEAATGGAVEVVNLMGRIGHVSIAMALAGETDGPREVRANVVLLHAAFGPVRLAQGLLAAGGTWLFDEGRATVAVRTGRVLVGTVTDPA